jgi:hypothetical protein
MRGAGRLSNAPAATPAVTIVGDLNYDYIYSCPALEGMCPNCKGRDLHVFGLYPVSIS